MINNDLVNIDPTAVTASAHRWSPYERALIRYLEKEWLEPAMDDHIERVGKPKVAAADSAFDDPVVHAYLNEQDIVGHITSRDHTKSKDGGYGTDRVTWNENTHGESSAHPLCPNQQPLMPKGKPHNGRQGYEGTDCTGCPIYE